MKKVSKRSYLLKAFYSWIVESAGTPVVVANANVAGCQVPQQYIEEDGEIAFNIAPEAVRDLKITPKELSFTATFSGMSYLVKLPLAAILTIFPNEDANDGIYFDTEEEVALFAPFEDAAEPISTPETKPTDVATAGKPFLKLVE